MNRIIIALLLLCPVACFSQGYIGKTRQQVKKELQREIAANDTLHILLTDNDSVLIYSYEDSKVRPVQFIYGFDRAGKCRSEKVMAGCDSCFNKYLLGVLDKKKYEWKKINENQYISKYSARMMIELSSENKDFSYIILSTDWNKDMYKLLRGE